MGYMSPFEWKFKVKIGILYVCPFSLGIPIVIIGAGMDWHAKIFFAFLGIFLYQITGMDQVLG